MESTYLLYRCGFIGMASKYNRQIHHTDLKLSFRATKNPFYLHVGRDILYNLNNHTKAVCGYATVHDVQVSIIKLNAMCYDLCSYMSSCAMIYRTRVWRTDRKAFSYQRLSRFDRTKIKLGLLFFNNCIAVLVPAI